MVLNIIIFSIIIIIAGFFGWLYFVSRKALKNKGNTFKELESIEEIITTKNLNEYYLVFTTPTCTICKNLKKRLSDKNIIHFEVPALKYPQISRKYNIAGVPTTFKMDKDKIIDVYIGDWL